MIQSSEIVQRAIVCTSSPFQINSSDKIVASALDSKQSSFSSSYNNYELLVPYNTAVERPHDPYVISDYILYLFDSYMHKTVGYKLPVAIRTSVADKLSYYLSGNSFDVPYSKTPTAIHYLLPCPFTNRRVYACPVSCTFFYADTKEPVVRMKVLHSSADSVSIRQFQMQNFWNRRRGSLYLVCNSIRDVLLDDFLNQNKNSYNLQLVSSIKAKVGNSMESILSALSFGDD